MNDPPGTGSLLLLSVLGGLPPQDSHLYPFPGSLQSQGRGLMPGWEPEAPDGQGFPWPPLCDGAQGKCELPTPTPVPLSAHVLLGGEQGPLQEPGVTVPGGSDWACARPVWPSPAGCLAMSEYRASTHHVLAFSGEGLLDVQGSHGALHVAINIADTLPPAYLLHGDAVQRLVGIHSFIHSFHHTYRHLLPQPRPQAAPGLVGDTG